MRQDQKLKKLIEDLLKDQLTEVEIEKRMEQLEVPYSANPTTRWKLLLEQLGTHEKPQETIL